MAKASGAQEGARGEGLNDLEYLGSEVRTAREGRELSQSQLGKAAGYSKSYISKVEAGLIIPSEKFTQKCDLVFGTPGMFERLRARIVDRGHPSWFAPYLKQEERAAEVLTYSPSVIPGILQTEEYARAIFLAWDPRVSEDILRSLVRTRRDRKAVFTRGSGPALWSIIHETALHTEVGDREVMCRALTHLREVAERPNITVQILPFTAGAPAVLEPFILLRQPDGHRTLFGDTVLGGQMSESSDRVGLLLQAYERLRGEALGTRESLALVSRKLDEFHGRMA